jgi:protoheme IX farnesyltransferase
MISSLMSLFRPRLSLMNGIAAAGGGLLYPAALDTVALTVAMVGVTLLAAGGSALNQVLERNLDLLMDRTRLRPLPSGRLSPPQATAAGVICIVAGLLLVTARGDFLPPLLATAALVCYLWGYTPLKRRTHLALAVGGVCGGIPPVIGYCLAGGTPSDPAILIVAGLFYLWQIPHFWLLQQQHEADYHAARIPLCGSEAVPGGMMLHVRLWLVALTAATMLLPAFSIIGRNAAVVICLLLSILMVVSLQRFRPALLAGLNLFPLLLTMAIAVQK